MKNLVSIVHYMGFREEAREIEDRGYIIILCYL